MVRNVIVKINFINNENTSITIETMNKIPYSKILNKIETTMSKRINEIIYVQIDNILFFYGGNGEWNKENWCKECDIYIDSCECQKCEICDKKIVSSMNCDCHNFLHNLFN